MEFLNNNYVTGTLMCFLSFVLLSFCFYLTWRYLQIKLPYQTPLRDKLEITDQDIAHHFFEKLDPSYTWKILKTDKELNLFRNTTNKNTFTIGRFPLKSQYYNISGLEMDYILGRAFLSYKSKHNGPLLWQRLLVMWVPVVCFVLYWLFFIANITMIIIKQSNPILIERFNLLNNLFKTQALIVILIILWGIYLTSVAVQPLIKQQWEGMYEKKIINYVKIEYPALLDNFILARRFSRSINYFYNFGLNWLLKTKYHYTGPFGAL